MTASDAGWSPEGRRDNRRAVKACACGLKNEIADAFLRLAAQPTFALDRLNRYEHLLWRQVRQTVLTLESFRRRKRAPSHSSFPFSFRRFEPRNLSEEVEYLAAQAARFAFIRLISSGFKPLRAILRS